MKNAILFLILPILVYALLLAGRTYNAPIVWELTERRKRQMLKGSLIFGLVGVLTTIFGAPMRTASVAAAVGVFGCWIGSRLIKIPGEHS